MFTKVELIDAINQLEAGKHSIQNCEKLAAIYTVLDHLYGDEDKAEMPLNQGYSFDSAPDIDNVGIYGKSKFLQTVAGKPAKKVWNLLDELVDAVLVLNPRLMDSFFDKLNDL